MKHFQQSYISITQSNARNENNEEVLSINSTNKIFTTRELILQEYFYNYYGTNVYSKLFNDH